MPFILTQRLISSGWLWVFLTHRKPAALPFWWRGYWFQALWLGLPLKCLMRRPGWRTVHRWAYQVLGLFLQPLLHGKALGVEKRGRVNFLCLQLGAQEELHGSLLHAPSLHLSLVREAAWHDRLELDNHSSGKYLLMVHCVPRTILDAWDTSVNSTAKDPCLTQQLTQSCLASGFLAVTWKQ